jgi:hypothetical protein
MMKQAIGWTLSSLAAAGGAWFSFRFGQQIGSPLVGVLAAVNGAVMCALMTSALLDRLSRLRRR